MRGRLLICVILVCGTPVVAQSPHTVSTPPSQFEVGLHTFVDMGPPFDFYEVFIVRSTGGGTSVEKITLTPPGQECVQPAMVETTSATISESVSALLGSKNPCLIPEKSLRRELKRRKDSLVFSGAHVVMRVQCGKQARLIRSDILDKDMFDPKPNTPEHTSWTMQLLARLTEATGPGVLDKPIFLTFEEEKPPREDSPSVNLEGLIAGEYDALFLGAPHKPSDLYRQAQVRPPAPTVQLLSSLPVQPEEVVLPTYPPLARLARIEGDVSFTAEVDANGHASKVAFESGHPLLRGVVFDAVAGWRFSKNAAGEQIHAVIAFALNCPAKSK